jgi:hypothetical protein
MNEDVSLETRKIESLDDFSDEELLMIMMHTPIKAVGRLMSTSKRMNNIANDKELWKVLIKNDLLNVPSEEDLLKLGSASYKDYYLKRSRTTMSFFERAANAADRDDVGGTLNNAMDGLFLGMDEMVQSMEQAAQPGNGNNRNIFQVMEDIQQQDPNNVNPFALMGQLMGGLVNTMQPQGENINNRAGDNDQQPQCQFQ